MKWPETVKNISSHVKRSAPFMGFGFEHIPFIIMYAVTIQLCISSIGKPYREAIDHHKALYASTLSDEDMWELEDDSDIIAILTFHGVPVPSPSWPSFLSMLSIGGIMLLHILLWFGQRWSSVFHCFVKYSTISEMKPDGYLYITPHQHQGAAEIVKIQRIKSINNTQSSEISYFYFQRQRFEVDLITQEVTELSCPIRLHISEYLDHKGHVTEKELKYSLAKYGNNSLHIPAPTFKTMYQKQIMGPIPVFQFFTTSLLFLDAYWYYALFNIASICGFEATTVFSRLKNLSTLRGMGNKSTNVYVRRCNKWEIVETTDLVPGDIVSIVKAEGKVETTIPCDCLILSGSAVVNEATLTGESVPQLKEAISGDGANGSTQLSMDDEHRVHVLFSGTTLLQQSPPPNGAPMKYKSPDTGVICYVLKTGFSSSQGKLVRMIEYSSEQVMVDVKETLMLFLILLCFAIVSSGYVMKTGLERGKQSQYQLVVRCIFILTSVVPPDLPLQTAVSVNTAVLALMKSQIFCTEPFRIPYAGRISYALFDKTGTLTTDQLTTVGTVCFKKGENETSVKSPSDMMKSSPEVCFVLAGAQSLVKVGDSIAGDPIETAAMKAIGWEYDPVTKTATPGVNAPPHVQRANAKVVILHRYRFASKLQRMSSVAIVESQSGVPGEVWSLVKGSPEAVRNLLIHVPANYNSTYQSMAKQGMRILALAYRKLGSFEADEALELSKSGTGLPREDVERDLIFCGFIAFSCLVRRDTAMVVNGLQKGAHRVAMATGDAALTALYVGKAVGITSSDDSKSLLLEKSKDGSALEWAFVSMDEKYPKDNIPYSAETLKSLFDQGYDLCMTGPSFQAAASRDDSDMLWNNIETVSIFARMAPEDKERVLRALKERGLFTLMCGDGANDVGALKQAHVGLALLAGFGGANTAKVGEELVVEETEQERLVREAKHLKAMKDKKTKMAAELKAEKAQLQQLQQQFFKEEVERLTLEKGESAWNNFTAMKTATGRLIAEQKKRAKARGEKYGSGLASHAAFMAEDTETGEVPMVKLGDASVAAPFTSKFPSIRSTLDIIRQGRCTLVSTIQMQQILALNCMIGAYSLSALYLDGVRSGQKQMIASSIFLSIAGIALTYARPVKELSSERPITSFFHPANFFSTFGQLAIHLYCMYCSVNLTHAIEPITEPSPIDLSAEAFTMTAAELEKEPELDEWGDIAMPPFTPTLLNTVIFLVETAQQVSVMLTNYKGRPFMLSSTENPAMLYSLLACVTGVFVCAYEVFPELNVYLELVSFPSSEFRDEILRLLFISTIGALVWDRFITLIFARRLMWVGYVDAWKALPKLDEVIGLWGKLLAGFAVLGLYAATDNMLVILGAGYMYRRYSTENAKKKEAQMIKLASKK